MSLLKKLGNALFGWLVPEIPEPLPPGAELTKVATDAYLPKIYGQVKKAPGLIIFKRTNDFDNDDLKNDLLHIIVVWGHSVSTIDEVYLDDIPASSNNELFFWEGQRIAHVLNFPNGMSGYSDPYLTAAGWEATDQLGGCACSYIRIAYMGDENTLNSEPTISADLTGTTWSNPMLALQSYLTNDRWGKGESASRIDSSALAAAQAVCDADVETFPGSGVTRKQFTFNGALDGENTVLDNLNTILKSCRALLPVIDGKLTPIIEQDDPPVALDIVEDDIVELGKITDSNKGNRYNRVIVEYYDDSANSTKQEVVYPEPGSAEETAWLAEDNGVLLEKREKLHSCRDYYEALSHAKAIAEVSRQQLRVTITMPIWAILYQVGDVVNVSHSFPGWVSKPFRIERTSIRRDDVELVMREHQPAVYVLPGEQAPPIIPDTGTPGGGGTVTPGQTDYTAFLQGRLQALINNGVGGELVLPQGDYYITDTLPLGSNITIRGAGMPSYRVYWLATSGTANDNGNLKIFCTDPDGRISHRLMSGDVVKLHLSNGADGIYSISSVDPDNSAITLNMPFQAIDNATRVRVSVLVGGTIIRFQDHLTGNITTGKRFFDCSDVRNFNLFDIGFVGPGINSVYGGGMRFRRVVDDDGRSRAITGYNWRNVFIAHAAMDAVRFDQLIHSYIGHLNINRCVGDGILFRAGPEGGTTTSVHIDTPYIQNVRRGIAMYTAAYCTFTNPVVEGTSYAYYINRGIGITLNAVASETVKYDPQQSGGATCLFVDCYGTVINAPTVYYNTEEAAWSKAALVFVDPNRRTESPTAVINGGHIHWSLGEKIPVIGTRWNERVGRLYVDVSNDWGYVPPDGATGSSWIGNSYWDDSVQVEIMDCQRDPDFNNRYRVTSIKKLDWIPAQATTQATAPTVTDDSNAGYVAFTSYWENTSEGTKEGRYFCIDDSVGAAVWVKVEQTFEIDFDARDYKVLGKAVEPAGCFALRLGRNYGVDVATDNIQRVLATSTDNVSAGNNGTLELKLDISHLFPVRFAVDVNFNPFGGSFTNAYSGDIPNEYVVKNITKQSVTFNTVTDDYIVVELIVGDSGAYFFWSYNGGVSNFPHEPDDLLDALNGYFDNEGTGDRIWIRYDDNGVTTQIEADLKKVDIRDGNSTGNLFLYFKADRFLQNGDTFTIQNAMIKAMDGQHSVNTVQLDEFGGYPCLHVVTNTTGLQTNLTESVDDAVYVMDKWSAPVSNQITMDGLDTLFVYDKVGAISNQDSRGGEITIPASESSVALNVPAANNFTFTARFLDSGDVPYVSAQDFKTVTFSFPSSGSARTLQWTAKRKKSPGLQAIYDRN